MILSATGTIAFRVNLDFDGESQPVAIAYNFGEAESCGEAAVKAFLAAQSYFNSNHQNELESALARHYQMLERHAVCA